MAEKPIIFSGAMVRAVIKGSKTQTRRVSNLDEINADPDAWHFCGLNGFGNAVFTKDEISYFEVKNPYGDKGDRLWVRETFALQCNVENDKPPFSDGRPVKRFDDEDDSGWLQPHYRATDPQPELTCPESPRHNCGSEDICASPWQPSIHMPRWASRLTLEITQVRVERVQGISRDDEIAEGMTCDQFPDLWEQINGKRGFGWEKNPWVWAISFRKVEAHAH